MNQPKHVLDGYKVLDFSQLVAGPTCTVLGEVFARPCGVFKGRDRYLILIMPLEQHWSKLCEAMGQPGLARNPRFIDNASRLSHLDELVAVIEGWLGSQSSDAAAIATLQAHHVPVAPTLSVAEALQHPHFRQRGTVRVPEQFRTETEAWHSTQ